MTRGLRVLLVSLRHKDCNFWLQVSARARFNLPLLTLHDKKKASVKPHREPSEVPFGKRSILFLLPSIESCALCCHCPLQSGLGGLAFDEGQFSVFG